MPAILKSVRFQNRALFVTAFETLSVYMWLLVLFKPGAIFYSDKIKQTIENKCMAALKRSGEWTWGFPNFIFLNKILCVLFWTIIFKFTSLFLPFLSFFNSLSIHTCVNSGSVYFPIIRHLLFFKVVVVEIIFLF